jgi:predicted DNA repair protein MutK
VFKDMIIRKKQIGSIRTFFVIGIVLTCLLVGSIFYLKNRGEAALIAQKESNSQESKAEESKNESTKDKSNENPVVVAVESDDSSDKEIVASDLPTTGPESTVAEITLLFMATFILASFVQSKVLKPVRSTDKNC